MPTLAWSDDLALPHAEMDHTRQGFVDLLADCEAALQAEPAELLARWQRLVDHTVEHFGQEDRWMAATGFEPENCHSFQHKAVLDVMKECARRAGLAEQPDFEPLKLAVAELAIWFPQHARQMDAALAGHMESLGYDAATGTLRSPIAEDAQRISGCGGSSCHTAEDAPADTAAAESAPATA